LKDNLNETYSVIGTAKQGADIITLSDSVKDTILTLGKNNALVFGGGANDISKNNSKKGLRHILNFVRKHTHANIVLSGIPYRHDLVNWSCVNNEINTFNRKFLKIMKCHEHVTVMNCDLNRQFFTRQSMHLNKMGKEEITKHITATCVTLFQSNKNLTPICLFWKESENYSVNLQTDKCLAINDSIKVTTELKNETVRKSNRLKKPTTYKKLVFFMVNKGAPLRNISLNRVTKKVDDIKLFNVFHQNIRGLRGGKKQIIKSTISSLPSYIMLYRTPYESPGTTTIKYRFL
jgi:hypothetical protein